MELDESFSVEFIQAEFAGFIELYKPLLNKTVISGEYKEKYLQVSNFKTYLPEYLNTNAKLELINKFKNYVTYKDFIKLLKHQTMGKDFAAFDTLVEIGELSYNKDGFAIIPQNGFVRGDYKLEPYFIYLILKYLQKDKLVSQFLQYLLGEVQGVLEEKITGIGRKRGKHMDLWFGYKLIQEMYVIVEIDEKGHSATVNNDSLKSTLARVYKSALIRLDATNKDLLEYVHGEKDTSEYFNHFMDNLKSLLLGMLFKHKSIRQQAIKLLFKEHLIEQRDDAQKSADEETEEDIKLGLLKTVDEYDDLLSDFTNEIVVELFQLKDRAKQNSKSIQFSKVCQLLGIQDKDTQIDLYKYLRKKNMLSQDDKISWLDLTGVINSKSTKSFVKEILFQYFKTVEYIYNDIIDKIEYLDKVCRYGYKSSRANGIRDFTVVFNACRDSQDAEIEFLQKKLKAANINNTQLQSRIVKLQNVQKQHDQLVIENQQLKTDNGELQFLKKHQDDIEMFYKDYTLLINNDGHPIDMIQQYIDFVQCLFTRDVVSTSKFARYVGQMKDNVNYLYEKMKKIKVKKQLA